MATWLCKFPDRMMGKAVGFGKGDGLSKKKGERCILWNLWWSIYRQWIAFLVKRILKTYSPNSCLRIGVSCVAPIPQSTSKSFVHTEFDQLIIKRKGWRDHGAMWFEPEGLSTWYSRWTKYSNPEKKNDMPPRSPNFNVQASAHDNWCWGVWFVLSTHPNPWKKFKTLKFGGVGGRSCPGFEYFVHLRSGDVGRLWHARILQPDCKKNCPGLKPFRFVVSGMARPSAATNLASAHCNETQSRTWLLGRSKNADRWLAENADRWLADFKVSCMHFVTRSYIRINWTWERLENGLFYGGAGAIAMKNTAFILLQQSRTALTWVGKPDFQTHWYCTRACIVNWHFTSIRRPTADAAQKDRGQQRMLDHANPAQWVLWHSLHPWL